MFKDLGQVAYEAQVTRSKGVASDGSPMPSWEGLSEDLKLQWEAAALRVVEFKAAALEERKKRGH